MAAAIVVSGSCHRASSPLSRSLLLARHLFFPSPEIHSAYQSYARPLSSITHSAGTDLELDADDPQQQRLSFQRPLENGLDQGVFKAILVGKVGQKPVQKFLKSGRPVTLFSLGTGGIRNNRRPLDDEDPREYADRCAVQWHRVAVYPERLGNVALKHVKPGGVVYLEGNLETKIFSDPITGLVRRIREVAIRRDGRLVFVSGEAEDKQAAGLDLKGVGYY
ncbi:unnamed protein product [Spirodela intermedia]|uniref:Uncharacterized protein n=1 Tax=Spirodela intermedia TaxID=51605 RepID=A0A7I8J7U1_SPIIN|nr:unnamed protein product [Spirodela intermedia]CAA6665482.1 unnamed protein product [Spirodela intermedia]